MKTFELKKSSDQHHLERLLNRYAALLIPKIYHLTHFTNWNTDEIYPDRLLTQYITKLEYIKKTLNIFDCKYWF